jgi:nucleotide-binding universal stress UspA family protein
MGITETDVSKETADIVPTDDKYVSISGRPTQTDCWLPAGLEADSRASSVGQSARPGRAAMYNTILVPLDGSKRAEKILPHVEELAQRYAAKVVFLQVVEPPSTVMMPGIAFMDYVELYQEGLERRVEQAESYIAAKQGEFREKSIKAEICIDYAPVVEAIIRTAERERADLIAIASHGRTGLSRVFYGSVAAGVLHAVDRPLLLIRSQGDE